MEEESSLLYIIVATLLSLHPATQHGAQRGRCHTGTILHPGTEQNIFVGLHLSRRKRAHNDTRNIVTILCRASCNTREQLY